MSDPQQPEPVQPGPIQPQPVPVTSEPGNGGPVGLGQPASNDEGAQGSTVSEETNLSTTSYVNPDEDDVNIDTFGGDQPTATEQQLREGNVPGEPTKEQLFAASDTGPNRQGNAYGPSRDDIENMIAEVESRKSGILRDAERLQAELDNLNSQLNDFDSNVNLNIGNQMESGDKENADT